MNWHDNHTKRGKWTKTYYAETDESSNSYGITLVWFFFKHLLVRWNYEEKNGMIYKIYFQECSLLVFKLLNLSNIEIVLPFVQWMENKSVFKSILCLECNRMIKNKNSFTRCKSKGLCRRFFILNRARNFRFASGAYYIIENVLMRASVRLLTVFAPIEFHIRCPLKRDPSWVPHFISYCK